MKISSHIHLICSLIFFSGITNAQEQIIPLRYNKELFNKKSNSPTIRTAVALPFLDDFAYAYKSVVPDSTLWINDGAFVNMTFPVNPISMGVASLDGLDDRGIPYDTLSFNFGSIDSADMLTSMPILMSGIDSVYMIFYYQGGGLGDQPDSTKFNQITFNVDFGDSLVLEFKDVVGQWKHIWATDGEKSDIFKRKTILITDPAFYHNDFQFRFRNYASLIGNYDQWHIDYVRLKEKDTVITDVAIQYYPTSLLENYEAMTWKQFSNYQEKEKAPKHYLTVINNLTNIQNVAYQFETFNKITGAPVFNSGAFGENIFPATSTPLPLDSFAIPDVSADTVILTTKYSIGGVTADNNLKNDTVYRDQVFSNYFAYDDGTAEGAYRLLGSPAYVAQRYFLNEPDSLQGVMIHFANTDVNQTQTVFSLLVWASRDLEDTLYRDDFLKPAFPDTVNGFAFYRLEYPVYVVDSFYIGWQQVSITQDIKIDIGFDLNDTANHQLFYNINDEWKQSTIAGAVMMRPVLGKNIPFGIGIDDPQSSASGVVVYPNPATNILNIKTDDYDQYTFEVISYTGKQMNIKSKSSSVDISGIPDGLYFIRGTDLRNGKTFIKKFVKAGN